MRIVIPGGTGQVGTLLARTFHADDHEVVVLSRRAAPAPWRVSAWDARTVGPWAAVRAMALASELYRCVTLGHFRRAAWEIG